MIYGRNNTIHQTTDLNIEVDEKSGEVISVWFRCKALPFTVSKVDKHRVREMTAHYNSENIPEVIAVELKD